MYAEHLQSKPIKVSGHLEESRGIYQMILNWRTREGKRGRKSISTGLPVKGNKKRAEAMLNTTCKEKEQELAVLPEQGADLLFADFMEQWLDVIRKDVNGVPLKHIQEWLGHSDFAITANTYECVK